MITMGFIKSQNNTVIINKSIIVPETFTHSIAFGQTGSGKTTGFIYPNLKNRLELGHGILLYDYKGKEHLSVKYLADKTNRLDDVVEIGKPWGEYINIIENMDEGEIDNFFDNIVDHGKDGKYWQNSAKSLGQSILKVLKAIEGFSKCMSEADKKFLKNTKDLQVGFYSYPVKRTLTSLIKVCKTYDSLNDFIKNLDRLVLVTEDMMLQSAKKMISKESEIEQFKPIYTNLIESREKLLETIEETKDSLESFGDDSNENLTQNIIGSLISPLLSIAQNSFFNTNSFDIVSALNRGKIVIINTEAISDTVLESLNNMLLYELSKRTRSIKINPISIFIDEAQRVISKSTDIPIDILREAKVDLFLSTQNSALLKDKLESEKFNALMGNLTQKYYFKNSTDEELDSEHSLNLLESFEYLNSENSYSKVEKTEPFFVNLQKKMLIEFKYQKNLNILQNYAYKYRKSPIILEYIPRYYKEKKLLAIGVRSLKEQIIDSSDFKTMQHIDNEVIKLFKDALNELNNNSSNDYNYEMVDDTLDIPLAS